MLSSTGHSLLSEALSPSGRQVLNEFIEASAGTRSSTKGSPVNYTFQTLPLLTEVTCHSRHIVDVLRLTVSLHGSVIVSKVYPRKQPSALTSPKCSAASFPSSIDMDNLGLIRPDDTLVSINLRPVDDIDDALNWLAGLPLPLTLVNTLGEYTLDDLRRHAEHNRSRLLTRHVPADVAQMLHMMIELTNSGGSYRMLKDFIADADEFFLPTSLSSSSLTTSFDTVSRYIHQMHAFMAADDTNKRKQWAEDKQVRGKRLESMQKQLKLLETKLTAQAKATSTNVSQEYVDLRTLVDQLRLDIDHSKQMHYLPPCEGFTLRFGTAGVYVGVGDVWVSSYHTSFTIETQPHAPQILLRLTPLSESGLKIRAMNFKVYSEGRYMLVPTFHVDEMNIQVHFSADIPLVYDAAGGWRVQPDALQLNFSSLKYYERQTQSNVHGNAHDSVMKTFLNRIIPSVVQDAIPSILCPEVGALLVDGRAKVRLSGDLHVEGRNLAVFDAPLGAPSTRLGSGQEEEEEGAAAEARELVGCSVAQGDLLFKLHKQFVQVSATTSTKSKSNSSNTQLPHLAIRDLVEYGVRLRHAPAVRALLTACWQLAIHLLTPDDEEQSDYDGEPTLDFAKLMANVAQMETYPVDISLGLHSTNIRLDLCEVAAAAYTAMDRILRQNLAKAKPAKAVDIELELSALEATYNQVNVWLSTVASRVDELVVMVNGGLPAGFDSKFSFEATDLSCKGPWQASFAIPLTPPPSSWSSSSLPPAKNMPTNTAARTAISHDNGELVVSYFVPDMEGGESELQVRVQEAAFRVLLEVPPPNEDDPVVSTNNIQAMELKMDTTAAPSVSLSMGEFAKCAISCKRVALCSPMMALMATLVGHGWIEPVLLLDYLKSPFFAFSLRFFTSIQVTPEQMYWTLNSASLSDTAVSFVTHRLCVSQLLRDLNAKSTMDAESMGRNLVDASSSHRGTHHPSLSVTGRGVQQQQQSAATMNRSQSSVVAMPGKDNGHRPGLARQDTFLGDRDPRRHNMFELNEQDEPMQEPAVVDSSMAIRAAEGASDDDLYSF
ncbi:hypothetical protein DYB25_002280 [Aphanomyces astaci]|uniref:Uncharacterized protein n=1 Tax=Aphanomyces astaci TaxID=112090 RepID=A0A397BHQ1_APHAT|nr:hypothetical protein DYB25_002280 [Aphanomyces astaci]